MAIDCFALPGHAWPADRSRRKGRQARCKRPRSAVSSRILCSSTSAWRSKASCEAPFAYACSSQTASYERLCANQASRASDPVRKVRQAFGVARRQQVLQTLTIGLIATSQGIDKPSLDVRILPRQCPQPGAKRLRLGGLDDLMCRHSNIALAQVTIKLDQIHRLEKALVHTSGQTACALFRHRIGSDADDQAARSSIALLVLANRLGQLATIHQWHSRIGEHGVEIIGEPLVESLLAVGSGNHPVTKETELLLEQHETGRIVIHHQQGERSFVVVALTGRRAASCCGRRFGTHRVRPFAE